MLIDGFTKKCTNYKLCPKFPLWQELIKQSKTTQISKHTRQISNENLIEIYHAMFDCMYRPGDFSAKPNIYLCRFGAVLPISAFFPEY